MYTDLAAERAICLLTYILFLNITSSFSLSMQTVRFHFAVMKLFTTHDPTRTDS